MGRAYQPAWDYPVVELDELDGIDPTEMAAVRRAIAQAGSELAPGLGIEPAQVFFVERGGLAGERVGQPEGIGVVSVFCAGTGSRPFIGLDLQLMKTVCADEWLDLLHEVRTSLALEMAHAWMEVHVEELELPFAREDEDAAVAFARDWALGLGIVFAHLDPLLPRAPRDPDSPAARPPAPREPYTRNQPDTDLTREERHTS